MSYEEARKHPNNHVSETSWQRMKSLVDSLPPLQGLQEIRWTLGCNGFNLYVYFIRDGKYLDVSIDEEDNEVSGFLVLSNEGFPYRKYYCVEYQTEDETKKHIMGWYNKEIWEEPK